jgi:hypothetical protein
LVSDAAANTVGGEPALADDVAAGWAADWVLLPELLLPELLLPELLLPELLLPHPAASPRLVVARSTINARLDRCRLASQDDMILAPY